MSRFSHADHRSNQPLPELLSLLVQTKESGVVHVIGKSVKRLISEKEKTQALRAQYQGRSSDPLGLILVETGVLNRSELQDTLEELGLIILQRASADLDAISTFREESELVQPDTFGSLSSPRLILESARSFPDRAEKRRRIGQLSQFIGVEGDISLYAAGFDLTPGEAFVLSRINTTRKIEDILRLIPMPEEETLDIIYALSRCGVLRIGPPRKPVPLSAAQQKASMEVRRIVIEDELNAGELEERRELLELAENLPRMNHYEVLRIPKEAPLRLIDRAWEEMEERCNPLRASEPHLLDMESTMKAILERAKTAHELLSHPTRRKRYDGILEEISGGQQEVAPIHGENDAGLRTELVEANIKRADELVKDGEIYLAIQLLEQACAMDPRPEQLVKLARLMLRNPLWHRRAQRCLKTALDINPEFVDGWLELAEFWRRKNNRERHRKAIERALSIDSTHPKARKMYEQMLGPRGLKQFLKMSRQE